MPHEQIMATTEVTACHLGIRRFRGILWDHPDHDQCLLSPETEGVPLAAPQVHEKAQIPPP
jgi:hypothetical protein